MERNPRTDWSAVDDLIFGCANQAGEDNRNVGRMAVLLAGMPVGVPGTTVNRLCGSGMDAVGMAARAIKAGDCDFVVAGGVESMTRAPFVMPKADSAWSRSNGVYDTTIGWRFVNPAMKKQYGIDSMPQTADNVAADFNISRADQDAFAARSQARWAAAQEKGFQERDRARDRSAEERRSYRHRHGRASASGTTVEQLGKLKGVNGPDPPSPPAMLPASMTARRRWPFFPKRQQRRRHDATSARLRWPPPASSRASWVSGRRQPPRRFWRGLGSQSTRWM
jgi:acetyl-CoA C-acetyltransferase